MKWLLLAVTFCAAPLLTSCGGNGPIAPSTTTQPTAGGGTGGSGPTSGGGQTPPPASGCDTNQVLWGGDSSAANATAGSRFIPTGVMAQPRATHTATLLPNGKVLIVDGGQLDIDDLLVSIVAAEIFDPAQGKFTPVDPPCGARESHTATLLANGKVLIAGGNEFTNYPTWLPPAATAELYDPASGKFSNTGSMGVGRALHTATLLADGRVLMAGGTMNVGSGASTTTVTLASTEIYDPVMGTFSPAASMHDPRRGQTATMLPSGKVLIVGGENDQGALATAELYDPATNSFAATGNMDVPRTGHTATLLTSGKVLLAGGAPGNALFPGGIGPRLPAQPTAELYDPLTGAFVATGNMTIARIGHSATLLGDGTVLIAGGYMDYVTNPTYLGYQAFSSTEIYEPGTGSFKAGDSMNATRFSHTATALKDGSILFAGGIGADRPQASAEIYH